MWSVWFFQVVVVYNEGQEMSDMDLRAWAREHMALYKVSPLPYTAALLPETDNHVGISGRSNTIQKQKTAIDAMILPDYNYV